MLAALLRLVRNALLGAAVITGLFGHGTCAPATPDRPACTS